MKLQKQRQILLSSRQAEVVEVENHAHNVAEEWQIQQLRPQSSLETKLEATQGYQGTLQEQ